MESMTARALRIWNDFMVSIAVLESLLHSTLLLVCRLAFAAGFVLFVVLIVYVYFVRRKRRGSPSFCPPTTSLTNSGGASQSPSSSSCIPLQSFSAEKPSNARKRRGSPSFCPPTTSLTNSGGASQSPSSSSSVPLQSFSAEKPSNADRPWQVFINHRGPDVKRTLASVLYFWLLHKGLRAFFDQKEIQTGDVIDDKIKQAIDNASVHIAIFSKRYAESAYCLNELCLMRNSRGKIIPVFFDVKRSDLRWIDQRRKGRKRKGRKRESVYREAFARHEEKGRYDSQKLQEWKTALKEVSFEDGFDLKEMCNGDWGRLTKRLVDGVLKATGRQEKASPQYQSFEKASPRYQSFEAFFRLSF